VLLRGPPKVKISIHKCFALKYNMIAHFHLLSSIEYQAIADLFWCVASVLILAIDTKLMT
jgi:hypothetical protein